VNVPSAYLTKVVIPLPADGAITEVMGDLYQPDTTLNVFKMMAGTEDMYPGLMGMIHAVFGAEGIDAKHREMITLRAAKVLNVPYEWRANELIAINAGLSRDEIAAAAFDGPVAGVCEEYVVICRATDELSISGTLTDETLSALLTLFGETVTRKYITTIAWFNMLSLFNNGCRVPLETTNKIGNKASPI
jgi:hypothetical protein